MQVKDLEDIDEEILNDWCENHLKTVGEHTEEDLASEIIDMYKKLFVHYGWTVKK